MPDDLLKPEEASPLDLAQISSDPNSLERLRLVKAFIRIPDPDLRALLVELVERIAGPPAAEK